MKNLLLSAVVFASYLYLSLSGGVISWGLSHKGGELPPDIPAGAAEMLEQNNGIYLGDTTGKKVYFTFDLGYEAGYTAEVLDILKKYNIKATFFLCGNYLKEMDLVQRMTDEGHSLGNHTNHHKDLPKLSEQEITKDITDLKIQSKYFRPPQGRFDKRTLEIANSLGLKTVLWSNAIQDWGKSPIDAKASANKVIGRIHPGSIMLFHISNPGMPKMLDMLIPMINDKGYEISSLDLIIT